jgi:hypothetical protein
MEKGAATAVDRPTTQKTKPAKKRRCTFYLSGTLLEGYNRKQLETWLSNQDPLLKKIIREYGVEELSNKAKSYLPNYLVIPTTDNNQSIPFTPAPEILVPAIAKKTLKPLSAKQKATRIKYFQEHQAIFRYP